MDDRIEECSHPAWSAQHDGKTLCCVSCGTPWRAAGVDPAHEVDAADWRKLYEEECATTARLRSALGVVLMEPPNRPLAISVRRTAQFAWESTPDKPTEKKP